MFWLILIAAIFLGKFDCVVVSSKDYEPPIYFRYEPDNIYLIDPLDVGNDDQTKRKTNESEISLVLNCAVEMTPSTVATFIDTTSNSFRVSNHVKIKWFKDNIDLDYQQYLSSDEDIKREILSNGSLKLNFKQSSFSSSAAVKKISDLTNSKSNSNNKKPATTNNNNNNNKRNLLELVGIFKCLASDSFGKIISKPSKIYLINNNNNYLNNEASNSNANNNLKFIKQPENTTLVQGKRLVLKCKPNLTSILRNLSPNITQVQYKWFKDSKQISFTNKHYVLYKDGSFEIAQVNETDSGLYKCTAKFRSFLFESRQAFVKVNPKPTTTTTSQSTTQTTTSQNMMDKLKQSLLKLTPSFLLWPEDRSAQEYDEIIFECLAFTDYTLLPEFNSSINYIDHNLIAQTFTYKWLKDGVALDFRSKTKERRFSLIQGNNLRIEKIEESDAGTYTCRICNSINKDDRVDDNVDESSSSSYNSNVKTSSTTLTTNENNNQRVSDLSSVNEIERDECDERSGVLKVLVEPRFLKRPSNVNATLKSDVELECGAYGVPAPTIQWFKNGEPIYPSEYFQFNPNQGNLKILGIIAQDEGYYQCLASNELNTIQSVAQLIVFSDDYPNDNQQQYDYDLDYSNDNLNLNNKNTIKSKKASSAPTNTNNKDPVKEGSNNKQMQAAAATSASLTTTATPTTTTPSNIVHLSAPTDLRIVKIKSRSLLIEWKPPAIISNMPSSITKSPIVNNQLKSTDDTYEDDLIKSSSVNSTTSSSSSSSSKDSLVYSINWKAKNMDRQRELNTTRKSILIDELTPDTVYQIQVSAIMALVKGPYSFIEAKTESEASLPGPPVDFKAESVDLNLPSSTTISSTVKLKWKKPLTNANNIVKYRLYYQHLHYGPITPNDNIVDVQSSKRKNSDEESAEHDLMMSQENYNFYNSNDQGSLLDSNGDYAEDKLIASSERYIDIDVPTDADTSSLSTDSENYYEFLLEDLLKYSTYRFRLIALDSSSLLSDPNSLNGDNQTLLLLNDESMLSGENDNEYDEKLTRLNKNFNAVELIVETPSDVPDGPPENLQVETLNTTSILVRWDLPALEKRNGLIVGYKIAVKENDKQVWHSNEDSEPRSKIITGLLPKHKYSVRVTARTVNGSGPASDWIIAETFAHEMDESKVPGQPIELYAEPTDKSIVIHWLPPADSNKTLVRKYLLKYGIGYPDTEIELPGNRNSYIINSLIPSSQYVLSLKAVNNAGYGMEILKDVITKRKSALNENENLFPPLNVQAVAISRQSIEIRWTDWHLKPEEMIPDDRYYIVRYNIAEMTNAKYKYKNSTERNVIISDLKPNTLYDFSVKLVIGRRESDWSMTTSQMTMETSPMPRDITIKSDPKSPSSVILSWQAPNLSTNSDPTMSPTTGYVISYLDEGKLKENPNNKWKHEYITQNGQKTLLATIKKLKLDTVYYFKIQPRNNRAYGASSPTIIFKTPNAKGEGGSKIFMPSDSQLNGPDLNTNSSMDDALNSSVPINKDNSDNNMFWIIILIGTVIFTAILIGFVIFQCKRTKSSNNNSKKFQGGKRNSNAKTTTTTTNGNIKQKTNKKSNKKEKENEEQEDDDSSYHKHLHHQQQLLICNTSNTPNINTNHDLIVQSSQSHHLTCSNSSTTSTLIKQQQQQQHQQQQQRTPNHHTALIINNPNHMMMTLMNPLSINNNSNNSNNTATTSASTYNNNMNLDSEFYSNMTNQQLMTNNSNSETGNYSGESCFQFSHSYNNHSNHHSNHQQQHQQQQQQHQQQHHHLNNMRTSSMNDDRISQSGDLSNELTNTSAAIAAANAAFNAPIVNNNNVITSSSNNNNNSNSNTEQLFLRHTIRPKPIAIPLNTGSNSATSNSILGMNSNDPNMFVTSNSTRKSFKNLPIATATLISSTNGGPACNGSNHPLSFNFNDLSSKQQQQVGSQKIHYTARPYIIDNQVQTNGEYSNHSPASSSHSGGQPQVYDKIGNVLNTGSNAVSTKSLLQPLKSFSTNGNQAQITASIQPSSLSIPNTPAKYCDNLNNNNLANLTRSPAKKQLLVSLASATTTSTAVTRGNGVNYVNNNNKSSDILMMMGKSVENIYEKKLTNNNCNHEELTAEMANLEGIMKDLSAITAQQFEC